MTSTKAAFAAPVVLALALGLACSKSGSTAGVGASASTSSASATAASSGAGAGGAQGTGGSSLFDAGLDASDDADGSALTPDVYMNSTTELFVFDVTSNALALVGPLAGCGPGIQDIALDDDMNMLASDGTTMWNVDRTTGNCLGVAVSGASGSLPVAMTFVPKDTFGTATQALVGYTSASDYVRVDLATSQVTALGQLGGGYALSGDFVAVNGGPTYVSVVGNGCMDCIVEIDVMTGAVTKSWGNTQYRQNGLAYWGGVVYGFNGAGQVVETMFGATTSTTMPLSVNPQGYHFTGAGSTTAAPLLK